MSTRIRTEPAPGHEHALWAEETGSVAGRARIRARISGLHCSLCTGTIEKAVGKLDGIHRVAVSLTHEQALVDYDPARIHPEKIAATLRDIGYDLNDPRKARPFEEEEGRLVREGVRLLAASTASLGAIGLIATVTGVWSVLVPASVVALFVPVAFAILRPAGLSKAAAGALGVVAPGVAALVLRGAGVLAGTLIDWLAGALALTSVVVIAPHILRMAYQAARRGILNQHVLLEIGAFAGIAGGVIGLTGLLSGYPTAAFFAVSVLVTTYHIFSEWLSLLVKTRSSQAVKKLLDLQPDLARVRRDGGEAELPAEQVCVGNLVRVRPGERIPVDGRVSEGYSAVDVSLVTGEPIPQERGRGDAVISGSLNGTGTLLIETTAPAAESFLAQVVRHVEDARALKPGILHLVDRVLRIYTPTVLAISALALVSWLAGTAAFAGDGVDVRRAVFAALTVLVMGYPCAVGIAAPLAIVRGAGEAADLGIIMRTGEAFQTLRAVTHMALDKTGTLTEGRPALAAVQPVAGVDPDELLGLAGTAAEAHSEHPLARALTAGATRRGLTVPEARDFTSTTGFGVTATVHGHRIRVGRPALLTDAHIDVTPLADEIHQLEREGHTVVAVSRDAEVLGVLALADTARLEARHTVAALRAESIEPVLVTGDNPRTAAHIARQLGITEFRAEVLPDGKAELVRELQARGAKVAMVGDGINDAPALMQADVGIALGSGADIATESADIIVLRGGDVSLVLAARRISRGSYRRVKQNVALAFTFNGIGIPLATTGLVHPVWAMVAMAASVTTIFINSIGGRPSLLFQAIASVGRTPAPTGR
ncbi:heavy metal translocating P-type ATPase [Streptomyces sp. NPDC002851]